MKPYADLQRHRTSGLALLALASVVYGACFAFVAPALLLVFVVPIAVLAAMAIWALPDNFVRPPLRLLQGSFVAFTAALILWPNYLAIALPGLPWITLRRLIGLVVVVSLLLCTSTSEAFRARTARTLNAAPLFWKLLIAFVVIQTLSIAFSDDKGASIGFYVGTQVEWTAMFFAAAYVFTSTKNIDLWCRVLWMISIPIGVIALLESHEHRVLWAGHIPSFLRIENPDVSNLLVPKYRAGTDEYRVQATFSTSLGLAEYMALAFPFAVYFVLGKFDRITRAIAALSIPVILAAILVSKARLGVIGVCVTALTYTLFFGWMRWRTNRRDLIGPAIVLSYPAGFLVFLAATFYVGRLRRIVWGGGETVGSTDARFGQYAQGFSKILARPWGYGINRGPVALGWFTPSGQLTIDTYYLDVALDYGVQGFFIFYGMIILLVVSAGRHLLRAWQAGPDTRYLLPATAALVNFVVIKSVFSEQDNHPLAFMMFAMVLALIARLKPDEREVPARSAEHSAA